MIPSLPIRCLWVWAALLPACVPNPPKDSEPTIVLQPGPANGKDAFIHSAPRNRASNYGNRIELSAGAWTIGGDPFILRGLFDFDLSSIPAGSRIWKARLDLHVELTSMMWRGGNDLPPGHSTLTGPNTFSLRRVTSPWQEGTVTWDTQPSTTSAGEIILPASNQPNQDYLDIDVTGLMRTMMDNPQNSHGFSLQLVSESPYRQVLFASSDHPDETLRPRLELVLDGVD